MEVSGRAVISDIEIRLTEEEAGKLMHILLFQIDWEGDLHGRFAKDLHDDLEDLGVAVNRGG